MSQPVSRRALGLTIKLPWNSVDEFAVKFAKNLSDNGMFVKTSEPKPRATELAFKVMLASGEVVLQGTAISRWVRGEGDPLGPAGMGVEFLSLDPASRALFNKMLAQLRSPAPAPPRATPTHGLPAAEYSATFSDPEVFELLNASKK